MIKEEMIAEIKRAIKLAEDDGWVIINQEFVREDKCCCPLSALAMSRGYIPDLYWDNGDLADNLEWGPKEVNDFTIGFDNSCTEPLNDNSYQLLGVAIRQWIEQR